MSDHVDPVGEFVDGVLVAAVGEHEAEHDDLAAGVDPARGGLTGDGQGDPADAVCQPHQVVRPAAVVLEVDVVGHVVRRYPGSVPGPAPGGSRGRPSADQACIPPLRSTMSA